MSSPHLVITPGEPAGIGPDICIALCQQPVAARLVFIADPKLLKQRAKQIGMPLNIISIDTAYHTPEHKPGSMAVFPMPCYADVQAGRLEKKNALYVINTINHAVDMTLSGQVDALITGPVHKGIINEAGIAFTGHTQWIAQRTKTAQAVMLLTGPNLRVALVTTHIPLKAVASSLNQTLLESVLRICHHDLQTKLHIENPRMRVCGLNPHAGEAGYLGHEEIEIIIPVLTRLRQAGFQLQGPVAADTAFLPQTLGDTDVIVAMYHDQGLAVLKHRHFDQAVNITLGLPIIRTCVDHGTAIELAGSNQASASSLQAAVQTATQMVKAG